MQKKETKEGGIDWKEYAEKFANGFAKNFFESWVEKVKFQIHDFFDRLKRGFLGMFLAIIGLIFALVGVAKYLNELLQVSEGLGYTLVGVVILLFSILLINKK